MGSGVRAIMRIAATFGAALCCVGAASAGVVPPPNYGHSFVTIGAPGNRPALESERIYGAAVTGFPNLGQVNHEYRIDRLEMTVGQWYEFVQVAWPFAEAAGTPRESQVFTGGHITAHNLNTAAPPNYQMVQGWESVATAPSFRYAAWYCNWLQNGRPTVNVTSDTFTAGAYDLNTMTRNPGALYWIPSLDEWTKATYYDPNRYGAGLEGYWKYPGMSAVPLVGGPPGTPGAQTSGGGWYQTGPTPPPAPGSYPDVMSAWGLLDTSGGVTEWTDTVYSVFAGSRHVRGQGLGASPSRDEIDYLFFAGGVNGSGYGVRLASAIPAPAPITIVLGSTALIGRRRRRM